MYAQVQKPLDWEALAVTTKEPEFDPNSLRVIMKPGAWSEKEKTIAWESYMQTEGLSQQVSCQHCDCRKKPIVVVTQGNAQPPRQLVCFCTSCWSFTDIHHRREAQKDISFFRQFNPDTGKFLRALPYADEQHPRRIRGMDLQSLGLSLVSPPLWSNRMLQLRISSVSTEEAPCASCRTRSAHTLTTVNSSIVSDL